MKSVTVNIQIKLDIDEQCDAMTQVIDYMSDINEYMYGVEGLGNPSILVGEIEEQHIFDNEE